MTDRQALEAALDLLPINDPDWRWDLPLVDILAAARERLAQLPEKCERCDGFRGVDARSYPCEVVTAVVNCPTCHGSGKVYPAELVERIALVILQSDARDLRTHPEVEWYRTLAVAVLDVLNREAP